MIDLWYYSYSITLYSGVPSYLSLNQWFSLRTFQNTLLCYRNNVPLKLSMGNSMYVPLSLKSTHTRDNLARQMKASLCVAPSSKWEEPGEWNCHAQPQFWVLSLILEERETILRLDPFSFLGLTSLTGWFLLAFYVSINTTKWSKAGLLLSSLSLMVTIHFVWVFVRVQRDPT